MEYGKEWEKEMMRMTKKDLIEFIRRLCQNVITKKKLDNDLKLKYSVYYDHRMLKNRIYIFGFKET